MRICIITPEYPPMQGGVGDYTSHLALALRDLGLEVVVLTSTRAKSRSVEADIFDQVVANVDRWSFSCWQHILQGLVQFRPDVLHVQYQTAGYEMHPAINLLPLRLRLVKNRPRLAVTFHDLKVPYLFPKAGTIRRLPGYFLASHADAVIATNGEDYGNLSKDSLIGKVLGASTLHNSNRLFAVPIGSNIPKAPPAGFDREERRQRIGVEPGELLLAYFGFLNHSKGIDILLDAFSELIKTGLRARLLMAGGSYGDSDPTNVAYGQRIRAQVEASEYRSAVIWTGFTSREEASANLLASDLCVLPFNEGASLRHGSLMAAIEHELPIVTTNVKGQGLNHPVFPSLDGAVKLVPPRDVEALAKAIRELADSKPAREQLSRAVGQLASAFEWINIGREHARIYACLLDDKRSLSRHYVTSA